MPQKDAAILDVRGLADPAAAILAVLEAGLLPLTIVASLDPVALLGARRDRLRCHSQQRGSAWIVDVLPT